MTEEDQQLQERKWHAVTRLRPKPNIKTPRVAMAPHPSLSLVQASGPTRVHSFFAATSSHPKLYSNSFITPHVCHLWPDVDFFFLRTMFMSFYFYFFHLYNIIWLYYRPKNIFKIFNLLSHYLMNLIFFLINLSNNTSM